MTKHIQISEDIITDFIWLKSSALNPHELVMSNRKKRLKEYISTFDNVFVLPSIIACKDTLTIIDGHHRLSIMDYFNISKFPVTLINYSSSRILADREGKIDKNKILQASSKGKLLPPKTSEHVIVDDFGNKFPIIVLSSICGFNKD